MFSSVKRTSKTSYDIRTAIETLYVNSAKEESTLKPTSTDVTSDVNANTVKGDTNTGSTGDISSPHVQSDVAAMFDYAVTPSGESSVSSTCERGSDSSDGCSANSAVTIEMVRHNSTEDEMIFLECTSEDDASKQASSGKQLPKRRSLSQLFRRLSTTERQATRHDAKQAAAALADVRVDRLPQQCTARYLGSRPCSGLAGACHVRGAVEDLVEAADKRASKSGSIPRVHLLVSERGVHIITKTNQTSDNSLVQVEDISYGTQDPKYSAVFCFVRVRELSSLECHAYVCESPVSARKMALALTISFQRCAVKHAALPVPVENQ